MLVAGCAGGDDGISSTRLPELVLQPADLPDLWVQFDEGRQVRADAPPGRRADTDRFGREGGWKARYRRSGSADTTGPLVIESRADLFAESGGAEDELDLIAGDPGASLAPGARQVTPPSIGNEAVAATVRQEAVRYYLVAWRQENVVAMLVVNGFARSLTLADVERLARKQERRIARAAS